MQQQPEQPILIVRITGWADSPIAAPDGGQVFTVHHLAGNRYFSAAVTPEVLASPELTEQAWAKLEAQARTAMVDAVDCRHCGQPDGHPGLPGCPDVPLKPPGERSTRRVVARKTHTGPLTYNRFELLVDADHGVLVRDAHGAVWRDEARAPHWYVCPGARPVRTHVTGAARDLEQLGWLVPASDGTLRPTVMAGEILANLVR